MFLLELGLGASLNFQIRGSVMELGTAVPLGTPTTLTDYGPQLMLLNFPTRPAA